jgi:UDP-3-O-[3-hydroxymyristoyl] N-acetylglucosamine deacetylase
MNRLGQDIIANKIDQASTVVTAVVPERQNTILSTINCVGVALHSGQKVSLTLRPAEKNTGIVFRRTDIAGSRDIIASWDNVVDTRMCTTIGNDDGVRISTIEHLMSAFSGCGVDNVFVDVNGPEVPAMDGSAQPFVFLIECAGLLEQDANRRVIEILKPVRVVVGDKMAEFIPSDVFSVAFEIDFESEVIAKQAISLTLVNGTYKKEVSRARTFGFMNEVEHLKAAGLGLGGSLDNAVIVEDNKVLNENGLRYADEFVRHKVLDAVGDLYTAGGIFMGSYKGVRSGHSMTNQLLRALFADKSAWRFVDFKEKSDSNLVMTDEKLLNLVAAV